MRQGGPQSWSGHFGEWNNLLPLLGFKPQSVQPVGYRCTDCAIQALGQGKKTLQTFIIKLEKAKSC